MKIPKLTVPKIKERIPLVEKRKTAPIDDYIRSLYYEIISTTAYHKAMFGVKKNT